MAADAPLAWGHPLLERLDAELHAVCQPLTAMQLRLEIGLAQEDLAGLREAVIAALAEAQRAFAAVQQARAALQQPQAAQSSTLYP